MRNGIVHTSLPDKRADEVKLPTGASFSWLDLIVAAKCPKSEEPGVEETLSGLSQAEMMAQTALDLWERTLHLFAVIACTMGEEDCSSGQGDDEIAQFVTSDEIVPGNSRRALYL
jgi:hypothetical protein